MRYPLHPTILSNLRRDAQKYRQTRALPRPLTRDDVLLICIELDRQVYMARIVRNAQALGAALARRSIPILGAHKGYTTTHQVIVDVRKFGGGLSVAQRLAEANIITNKNLIPSDQPQDWERPGRLRMGTIEVTRLGMGVAEMEAIAGFIACILVEQQAPEEVRDEVIAFREPYQTLYYCFANGEPGQGGASA